MGAGSTGGTGRGWGACEGQAQAARHCWRGRKQSQFLTGEGGKAKTTMWFSLSLEEEQDWTLVPNSPL